MCQNSSVVCWQYVQFIVYQLYLSKCVFRRERRRVCICFVRIDAGTFCRAGTCIAESSNMGLLIYVSMLLIQKNHINAYYLNSKIVTPSILGGGGTRCELPREPHTGSGQAQVHKTVLNKTLAL